MPIARRVKRWWTVNNTDTPPMLAPLALRPKDAARALGIGQRKLWELSQPRGSIPSVRVGACVLYPTDELRAWLSAQAGKAVRP